MADEVMFRFSAIADNFTVDIDVTIENARRAFSWLIFMLHASVWRHEERNDHRNAKRRGRVEAIQRQRTTDPIQVIEDVRSNGPSCPIKTFRDAPTDRARKDEELQNFPRNWKPSAALDHIGLLRAGRRGSRHARWSMRQEPDDV
ncbi:hypothetical protein FALCPG4_017324 [Fusarium falciforme]